MQFFPFDEGGQPSATHGLLCINHEYTDDGLLHPDGMKTWTFDKVRKAQNAHGVSVIEVRAEGATMLGGEFVRRETGHGVDLTADLCDESRTVDRRARECVERGTLGRRPADVHSHADDDATEYRRCLSEYSGDFCITDNQVVRPLESHLDTGDLPRRPRCCESDDARHAREVTGLLPAEENRHEHVRSARRFPAAIEPTATRGLVVGDEDQTIGSTAAGAIHEVVVRAARFGDVLDRPGVEPRLGPRNPPRTMIPVRHNFTLSTAPGLLRAPRGVERTGPHDPQDPHRQPWRDRRPCHSYRA